MQTYEKPILCDISSLDLRPQEKRLAQLAPCTARHIRAERNTRYYEGRVTKRGRVVGETWCSLQTREIVLVNPDNRDYTSHRYVLCFGAYGDTVLMVWANGLEDALEECGEWIADHAPGLFCDDSVKDQFEELYEEYLSANRETCSCKGEEEPCEECTESARSDAWEGSEEDTTRLDNGHYLPSWEWGIVAEDPDRKTMLSLLGRVRG